MDEPSTSNPINSDEKISPDDIGALTTKTLERIIIKLKLEEASNINFFPINEPVVRTVRYTGMNKTNIHKVLAFGNTSKYKHIEIDRHSIHKSLIRMYLTNNAIPTITEFFNFVVDKLPIYVDIDYFTKLLIQMGYVFYKNPGRKTLYVMEKKTVTFERYRYLNRIHRYRKGSVPIVYVGLASLSKEMILLDLAKTLETEPTNILSHILFTATAENICNLEIFSVSTYEILNVTMKKWLLALLNTQSLPPGSAIVLEDSKIFHEHVIDVPTWKSVKADMVEWLEYHNIPCDIGMSKADLLRLIETCSDSNENTFVIESLIKTLNYSLLRLPQCINGLSMIPLIIQFQNYKKYFNNFNSFKDLAKMFECISSEELNVFSNTIKVEETEQMKDDIEVDKILDNLIRNIKTLEVEENEDDVIFPNSDSE